MKRFATALLTAATLISAPIAWAEEKNELDAEIEHYILTHPEVLIKSLKSYHGKETVSPDQAKQLKMMEEAFPIIGNKQGDVTLVEFFDYHCGFCKRFFPVISEVLEKDKNLKVVLLDFPILSEDSELAAKAALSVHVLAPEKYLGYHTALMKLNGKFEEANMISLAKQAGIDEGKFKSTLKSDKIAQRIAMVKAMASAMEVESTPTFIIQDRMVQGAVDAGKLTALISMARHPQEKPAAE